MEVDDTGLVVCEAVLESNEMDAAKFITDVLALSTAERRAEILKMLNFLLAALPSEAKSGWNWTGDLWRRTTRR